MVRLQAAGRLCALMAALFTCVAVSACASHERNPSLAAAGAPLPVPDSTGNEQRGSMRIQPLDILDVSVFNVDELSGRYQVDHIGQIKMPLIGAVSAQGYTSIELSVELEEKLEEKYLQDPDVSVIIVETTDVQLTVEGSVNDPGMYPVRGKMTLLQAVALAGGPSDGANPERVVIFRQVEGERRAGLYDLTAIREGLAEDPVVYASDIIIMDGSEARRVWGDVVRSAPLVAMLAALGF